MRPGHPTRRPPGRRRRRRCATSCPAPVRLGTLRRDPDVPDAAGEGAGAPAVPTCGFTSERRDPRPLAGQYDATVRSRVLGATVALAVLLVVIAACQTEDPDVAADRPSRRSKRRARCRRPPHDDHPASLLRGPARRHPLRHRQSARASSRGDHAGQRHDGRQRAARRPGHPAPVGDGVHHDHAAEADHDPTVDGPPLVPTLAP